MYISIGIADLVGNAFIELIKKSKGQQVTFSQIEAYGAAVIEQLNNQGDKAILILSREGTNEFLHDYKDFFEVVDSTEGKTLCLKQGKTIEELERVFRSYLTWDMLCAFIAAQPLAALGV